MLKTWLRYLWENQDGFFGIGMGPSRQEQDQYGLLSGAGKFGIGTGESDVLKASNFWSAILSGDMSKISGVLGPELSAINKQGQERKKTMSEFGSRSGGVNATAGAIDTNVLSSIRGMISGLTGGAASSLGSMGTSLFGQGIGATGEAFGEAKTMHDQDQQKWADIFQSIASIAGTVGGFFPAGSMMRKVGQGVGGVIQS